MEHPLRHSRSPLPLEYHPADRGVLFPARPFATREGSRTGRTSDARRIMRKVVESKDQGGMENLYEGKRILVSRLGERSKFHVFSCFCRGLAPRLSLSLNINHLAPYTPSHQKLLVNARTEPPKSRVDSHAEHNERIQVHIAKRLTLRKRSERQRKYPMGQPEIQPTVFIHFLAEPRKGLCTLNK